MGGKAIPSGWISTWKYRGSRWDTEWEVNFPQGVRRLRLLDVMTGTDKDAPGTKFVTKGTYCLMNGLHAFGDLGQHLEGVVISSGAAYAALQLCVELAVALTNELPMK